ncbi:hypothetical protein [Aquabacterium sp.]|uniref:hypothetical protein n=1 Tax=Aquabacterium sp. TaxID=1872578 RepID=UPI003CFD9B55
MKKFELPGGTYLTVSKSTPRKECHGDEHVQAISLRLSWTTTNDSLEKLHPNLKAMLFWKTPSEEAQERLEGVPEITPNLRVPTVATPLAISAKYSGYQLTIDHGLDESSALQLYQCEMDKFKVDPKEGGSVTISWSLSSNKSVTPELVGALCGLEGEEVTVELVAPEVTQDDVIDGTQDAFDADHPGNDGPLFDDDAPAMDATDAFVRSGTDEGLSAEDDYAEVEQDHHPEVATGRRARRSADAGATME